MNSIALKAPFLLSHAVSQHGLRVNYKTRFNASTPVIYVYDYEENPIAEYWYKNDEIQERRFANQ